MEKPTILIVEDEQLNRAILVHMLHEKYSILQAENGLEAFDQMRDNKVDLILLDLFMPVMDGMKFLEKRLEYEDYANIPVIVTTQDRDPLIEATAFELGVKEFVVKPYNAQILLRRIRDSLRIKEEKKDLQGVTVTISSNKLLDIIDEIPYAVAIFEVRGIVDFLYYNEGFSRLLGYSAKELEETAPSDPFELIHEEDVDFLAHKINQAISLGINLDLSFRALAKNQSYVTIEMKAQLHRESNSFPQFYGIFKLADGT